ncbi:hypothetical protein SO802_021747 [Lithocarpus litseifolius]|uniref:Gustatory receptor n=1 Tax=Lithocarpus litseifolius TaxID=425828 RepID=A0AAW2CH16_9ROSI
MDRAQEELQFLGFFGIFKESFKTIFSRRKIFSQITLALILPLSFIYLAQIQISQLLFSKIIDHNEALDDTQKNSTDYEKLSHRISAEWAYFWLFKIAYFTILLILSLLSTSAVVYTIACIYTAKEITFKKVMSVVPKVWKRLMVTFLWSFTILFVYSIVAIAIIIVLLAVFFSNSVIGIVIIIILLILYLMGFVYISIVWQLASVVSVLEGIRGIQAMKKSKTLIKGKMGVAVAFFILLCTCFVGIDLVFEYIVVLENVPDIAIRIVVGILSLLFLFKLILIALVVQTVVYFVCKSYHHQTIDKSALADHLEAVYLGDYVRLRKDIQLGDTHA